MISLNQLCIQYVKDEIVRIHSAQTAMKQEWRDAIRDDTKTPIGVPLRSKLQAKLALNSEKLREHHMALAWFKGRDLLSAEESRSKARPFCERARDRPTLSNMWNIVAHTISMCRAEYNRHETVRRETLRYVSVYFRVVITRRSDLEYQYEVVKHQRCMDELTKDKPDYVVKVIADAITPSDIRRYANTIFDRPSGEYLWRGAVCLYQADDGVWKCDCIVDDFFPDKH